MSDQADQVAHEQQMLAIGRRNLVYLRNQASMFEAQYLPQHIAYSINLALDVVRQAKKHLRQLGVKVIDAPNE